MVRRSTTSSSRPSSPKHPSVSEGLRGTSPCATNQLRMAKGHQAPQQHVADTMATTTTVTGVIGTIGDPSDPKTSLWARIESALEQRNWNWSRLAKEVPCSRQNIVNACRRGRVPDILFRRLCQIFDWEPTTVIDLAWKPPDDDRRSNDSTDQ